ncbi:hypothetical protein ACFV29_40050 [Streptomyces sp. NPDC059690]|uniref:hypothetical protein n=1 Tax=Streptomyces sp. NPDC059690 TaxID=3346907 RepID=UPI003695708C
MSHGHGGLEPAQRDLLAHLGLTPGQIDLDRPHTPSGTPAARRRSFAQTVQILALFLQRWQRTPGARPVRTGNRAAPRAG